ncbi:MAG: 30S ribosomal protein S6 [Anaerolineae bacterium]|nr:30S ribosomal protein S6 [Anaerolineae bacterium]
MAEEVRRYELTFILPPALSEEDIQGRQETVRGWIANNAGEIVKESHWGRRRLAYPIQNYKEGYYILMEFAGPTDGIKDLDRRMRLDTGYLRHLIVRVDE